MRKRKWITVLMAAVFAGCGSSSADSEKGESTEAAQNAFEAFTAIDNEECSVVISELDTGGLFGYTVKTELENKSAEKTYMFTLDSASVNGVMCSALLAEEVAPGKKSNESITIASEELKKNGITEYTDIELVFRIYDSDDWSADPVAKEAVHIYPQGEEHAQKFVREAQPTDQVLVDNAQVSVIVTGYDPDHLWGYTANLYLVNKTGSELMFSVNDASVNGYMADPLFATAVGADRSAFTGISWSDSVLKEKGIDEVKEIEFTMRVYDTNDWLNDIVNETFTLQP